MVRTTSLSYDREVWSLVFQLSFVEICDVAIAMLLYSVQTTLSHSNPLINFDNRCFLFHKFKCMLLFMHCSLLCVITLLANFILFLTGSITLSVEERISNY